MPSITRAPAVDHPQGPVTIKVSTQDRVWNELLQWLLDRSTETQTFKAKIHYSIDRGRSLVATQDINRSTPILSLPQSVLLTIKSIPQPFKNSLQPNLNSIQALTLYIANFRSTQTSSDPHHQISSHQNPFRPYLLTFPDHFFEIPLTWVLRATFGDMDLIHPQDSSSLKRLRDSIDSYQPQSFDPDGPFKHYQLMSTTTIKHSHHVLRRFYNDWSILTHDLIRISPRITLSELLWAWLVVNTRCVWYNLGFDNHADNIALAPAFDMANHSPISTVTPVMTPHTLTMYSSYPRGNFTSPRSHQVLSSSKPSDSDSKDHVCIKKGDEITFSYGPHGNSTLLAEYGFISTDSNPWDSIDITAGIESLFHGLEGPEAERKISILEQNNYWSDYTIQCNPIELSHRNLVALRLLHTPLDRLNEWQEHVDGQIDQLDEDIERAVRNSLDDILVDSHRKAQSLLDLITEAEDHRLGLTVYSFRCLKSLASNELHVFSQLQPKQKVNV